MELERARRAFSQIRRSDGREVEITAGESSLAPTTNEMSTINGAKIYVGTTKCSPSDDLIVSEKSDPPTC